jgi:hypothetical protein
MARSGLQARSGLLARLGVRVRSAHLDSSALLAAQELMALSAPIWSAMCSLWATAATEAVMGLLAETGGDARAAGQGQYRRIDEQDDAAHSLIIQSDVWPMGA